MKIDSALAAAKLFHVFPLEPGSKLPHIDDFPHRASRDPEVIAQWWTCPVTDLLQDYNIGISTTHGLLVVDVDNKNGKNGDDELLKLELQGFDLPPTYEQVTPTGGRHLIYAVHTPVKQGANVLGPGLDVRSKGGYIVGAGSEVAAGTYTAIERLIAPAPQWLIDRCGKAVERTQIGHDPAQIGKIDQDRATRRAVEYLATAPLAIEGKSGDQTTYQVAARLKDFGVDAAAAFELMHEQWNRRCSPPWDADELIQKVENAYRYGQEPVGAAAPETQFPPITGDVPRDSGISGSRAGSDSPGDAHPFQILNAEYAFVIAGGGHHILWETQDEHGRDRLEHLNIASFHAKHAAWFMQIGGKSKSVTELWMTDKNRRSFDGLCFAPGLLAPPRFYNLWRGFSVEPAKESYEGSVPLKMFLEHAFANVCNGVAALFKWLIGYFAHMVQRPWEKPLTALVFRGGKGVGKNALVDCVGALLGNHYLLASNRRYLVSNFNGHLENCLFFVLDEAFWSGDKQAEGVLKDLITGKTHVVEHKGEKPYTVDNRTRIAIIGNEDWIIPASHDERRFAVFDVGDGRKQDRRFFQTMREGMEAGGYALLLRYLLDYDLAGLDLNEAPHTKALLEQKHASLEPLDQWWLDCLTEGYLVGGDFDGQWPEEVSTERFRRAFGKYLRDRNIRSRMPDSRTIGRMVKRCIPSATRYRIREDKDTLGYAYKLPALEAARLDWSTHIGHEVNWE
jgi:Bifunctional DNA primase/polymerase, N-terminal/Family of unknown function (DUF5906)